MLKFRQPKIHRLAAGDKDYVRVSDYATLCGYAGSISSFDRHPYVLLCEDIPQRLVSDSDALVTCVSCYNRTRGIPNRPKKKQRVFKSLHLRQFNKQRNLF